MTARRLLFVLTACLTASFAVAAAQTKPA